MTNSMFLRRNPSVSDALSLARNFFAHDPFLTIPARSANASFEPAFTVQESEEGYRISADVPGLKESDLDISVENQVLKISGSRESEAKQEGERYHLYERRFGKFSRSFGLPKEADTETISAKLNDGVLSIHIGKRPETQPRKINVGA